MFLSSILKRIPHLLFPERQSGESAQESTFIREFENMITDSRNALGSNYANDTKPYRQITRMAVECDNLNTAYQMLKLDVYAEKWYKTYAACWP